MALYADDGSINVTVVDGTSITGLYAADGSINVVQTDGSVYTGLQAPCGARNVFFVTDEYVGAMAANGALNVCQTPYASTGALKVTVVSGSVGGSWTPADLGAPLLVWLDASLLSQGDDTDVAVWEDQSGNGNDATGIINFEPRFRTNVLNGMGIVRFATQQRSAIGTLGLSGGRAGTVIGLVKCVADPGAGMGGWYETGSNASANHYSWSDGNIYDGFLSDTRKTVGDPPVALDTWHIAMFRSATNDWTYWQNGTQFFSTGTNTLAGGGAHALAINATSVFWTGDIAELMFVDAAISSTDREKVEGYLAHKWGIESVLDVGHPYKDAAP